jgi:hypothetical protein
MMGSVGTPFLASVVLQHHALMNMQLIRRKLGAI